MEKKNHKRMIIIGTIGLISLSALSAIIAYEIGMSKMSRLLRKGIVRAVARKDRVYCEYKGKFYQMFPIEIPRSKTTKTTGTAWRYYFDGGVKIGDLIKDDMIDGFGKNLNANVSIDVIDFMQFDK